MSEIREYRNKRRPSVRAWLFTKDHGDGRTPAPPEIMAAGGRLLDGQFSLKIAGCRVYLRPGDWVLFADGGWPDLVLSSDQFAVAYEPVPALPATEQIQALGAVLPKIDAVRLAEAYRVCLAAGLLEAEAYAAAILSLYSDAVDRLVAESDADADVFTQRINALQNLIFSRPVVRRLNEAKRQIREAAAPETRQSS